MIKDAIEKILDLASPAIFDELGEKYSSKPIFPIKPHTIPLQRPLEVKTLSGVFDWLVSSEGNEARGNGCTLHIQDFNSVSVFSGINEYHRDRHGYINASFKPDAFVFGKYYRQEDFVINASSKFEMDDNLKNVLKLVSKIRTSEVVTSEDDGISQGVTMTNDVKRLEETKVQPFHDLYPYRTFREIIQPHSRFLLRVRKSGGYPEVALFEADNSNWKIDAMESIREYFRFRIAEHPEFDDGFFSNVNIIM